MSPVMTRDSGKPLLGQACSYGPKTPTLASLQVSTGIVAPSLVLVVQHRPTVLETVTCAPPPALFDVPQPRLLPQHHEPIHEHATIVRAPPRRLAELGQHRGPVLFAASPQPLLHLSLCHADPLGHAYNLPRPMKNSRTCPSYLRMRQRPPPVDVLEDRIGRRRLPPRRLNP
jgi:hypothetical protein